MHVNTRFGSKRNTLSSWCIIAWCYGTSVRYVQLYRQRDEDRIWLLFLSESPAELQLAATVMQFLDYRNAEGSTAHRAIAIAHSRFDSNSCNLCQLFFIIPNLCTDRAATARGTRPPVLPIIASRQMDRDEESWQRTAGYLVRPYRYFLDGLSRMLKRDFRWTRRNRDVPFTREKKDVRDFKREKRKSDASSGRRGRRKG